jgi:O-acetyl-ADP-ribose deacetylase
MKDKIVDLIKGDITTLDTDAIVNAANTSLLGGGGVDGAIHRAAGPELLEECRKLGGCKTGEAKMTKGYRLRAGYIIHTAGPVWRGGNSNEQNLLASCYRSCLTIANENLFTSVAIPCISTGVYGFPKEKAAKIAVNETRKFMTNNNYPGRVIFVTFSDSDYEIYRRLLGL